MRLDEGDDVPFDHLDRGGGLDDELLRGRRRGRARPSPCTSSRTPSGCATTSSALFEAADSRARPGRRGRAQLGGRRRAAPPASRSRAPWPSWSTRSSTPDFHDLDVRRARVMLVEQVDDLLTPFSQPSRDYARRAAAPPRGGGAPRHRGAPDRRRPRRAARAARWSRPGSCCGPRGSRRRGWPRPSGSSRGRAGRITVAPDLSIPGHPEAFAIGDIADIDDGRRRAAATAGPGGAAGRAPRRRAGRWPTGPVGTAGDVPLPGQGHHGHHRAPGGGGRAARRPAPAAGRWPGSPGWGSTSSTWSACATGSR